MNSDRMDKLIELLANLDYAYTEPGPHPEYHQYQQDRLREEWPPLDDAIEHLRKWMRNK